MGSWYHAGGVAHAETSGPLAPSAMLVRLVVLPILLGIAGCGPSAWDYVPVVRDEQVGLTEAPELATPEHLDRAEQVFAYYGRPTERTSPTSLRVHDEPMTRELVWNYTTKAEDAGWLREHPAP